MSSVLHMQGPPDDDDSAPDATIATLRGILGDRGLLQFLDTHGGTRIKVPQVARPSSNLAEVVGPEALTSLVEAYGGSYLSIPVARRFRIVEMRKQGFSYSQIAARLCMTEGTVYRHLHDSGMTDHGKAKRKARADAPHLATPRKLP